MAARMARERKFLTNGAPVDGGMEHAYNNRRSVDRSYPRE